MKNGQSFSEFQLTIPRSSRIFTQEIYCTHSNALYSSCHSWIHSLLLTIKLFHLFLTAFTSTIHIYFFSNTVWTLHHPEQFVGGAQFGSRPKLKRSLLVRSPQLHVSTLGPGKYIESSPVFA